jgi:hypothetical protein
LTAEDITGLKHSTKEVLKFFAFICQYMVMYAGYAFVRIFIDIKVDN